MYFYGSKNVICIRNGSQTDVGLHPTVCGIHHGHDGLATVAVTVAVSAVVVAMVTAAAAIHGVILAAGRAAV